jgi:hypothetical protein
MYQGINIQNPGARSQNHDRESRSQNSEFRIQQSGGSIQNGRKIRLEQFARFLKLRHEMQCIPIAEILSQDQIIPAFLNRSLGYIQVSGLIRQSLFLEAFSDICGNGNRGSSYLRCQPIKLAFWVRFTVPINRQNEPMSFFPDNQIPEFLCRLPFHPLFCLPVLFEFCLLSFLFDPLPL